jgi:SAM-dependent methyltransferase
MFQGGALAAASIVDALEKNGVRIESVGSVLDFGCGCGRVVRHWVHLNADVYGCDFNPRSVGWCRRRLPFARFASNALHPPLPYKSGQFDLVYALSVFTHLPEPLALAWIREMARVLKPEGLLLITTHGEAYLGELTEDERRMFRQGRLVVRNPDAAGTNYCGVYCSEGYVRQTLCAGFDLVDFVPRGAKGNPHQDLVLLRCAGDGR